MAKKDWEEVLSLLEEKELNFLKKFIRSNDVFYPEKSVISANDIGKNNPGKWIPVYKKEDVPEILHKNRIYPIRAGQGSFFFYKGDIFLGLDNIKFERKYRYKLKLIENFIPLTLCVDFQGNENAYLNKAYALGLINDFTKERERLLNGQFGKIKITKNLEFRTSKGKHQLESGLQFEIDLLLESSSTIYIFEAKFGHKERKDFVLLQLYYPLIYIHSLVGDKKIIRTIFIDIIKSQNTETYKLMEIRFNHLNFDEVEILKSIQYKI